MDTGKKTAEVLEMTLELFGRRILGTWGLGVQCKTKERVQALNEHAPSDVVIPWLMGRSTAKEGSGQGTLNGGLG